jgi:hypothetical protein
MQNSIEIINEALPHLTESPFFSNQPNERPDGNSVLYSGELIDLQDEYKQVTEYTENFFYHLLAQITVKFGTIKRGSFHDHFQTHDDYIGACRAAQIIDPRIAKEIFIAGKTNFWCYQDQEPKSFRDRWNSYFWRIPGVVQHIKICASEPLNPLDQILFFIGTWSTTLSKKESTSGRRLDRLRMRAYKDQRYPHRYWLCDKAVEIFENDIRERYPKGFFGDVNQIFFQRDPELKQEPTHFFARWLQGRV